MCSWRWDRAKADRRHPGWQNPVQDWRRCPGIGRDRAPALMMRNKVLTLRFAISNVGRVSKQQLYEDSPAHQVNKTCVSPMTPPNFTAVSVSEAQRE